MDRANECPMRTTAGPTATTLRERNKLAMGTIEDHGIEIEDRAWLPADGRDVYYFPEPHLGHGDAERVTRVTSRNGKTWYAATSDIRSPLNPDVFVMPGGKRPFIRSVLVDAEDPLCWEKVPLSRVEGCLISPDSKIAVMHDRCAAAAYSQSGLHWLVRLDHLEGIKFTGVDNNQVFITATVDSDIVAQAPIALALWSGGMIFGPKE